MMRLALAFLMLFIALPVLAQSSAPVRIEAVLASINRDDSGDASTEEAAASPEVLPPDQPTDIPNPTSTPLPVMVETTFPTATLPPTETIPVPSPGADQPTDTPVESTSTPSIVPTVTTILPTAALLSTDSATGAPTGEALQSLTPESFASAMPPTALPYPTVVLPPLTSIPLVLPASAFFDDGAHDWSASPGWSLQSHENGLAWVMTGSGSGMLFWQSPISLVGAVAPVTLTFQSWVSGSGVAVVQVSVGGQDWQPIAVAPPSEGWTTVSVDLSHFVGGVIFIGFAWQGANADASGQWAIDSVLVAASPPTEIPPVPVSTEIVIEPSPTSALIAAATATNTEIADTATPQIIETMQPTAIVSETADTENVPESTDEKPGTFDAATETPTVIPSTVPTEEVSATSTDTVQLAATEQAASVLIVCELDIDGDGVVTETDLVQIGREAFDTAAGEPSVYDLDGNQQVDIGDLQIMTGYLFETCSR
ncbi:MAG: hypothetical protein IT319_13005 [Anaerolineae bacterium]|nr:hypothetical protein [Anaerolineae bacterium]